ncbi:hypothetical protein SBA3_1850006 [Candidatus Sulfopaludibacter sp. SbA3]|nr:hypothetical protein SBA3_1850006 [Candidatus Sulfopaludibacter sp. SbA3]
MTPPEMRVPMTIPIDSVNTVSVNDSSFYVRNLSMKLMDC